MVLILKLQTWRKMMKPDDWDKVVVVVCVVIAVLLITGLI
jgi:hypothetical protein